MFASKNEIMDMSAIEIEARRINLLDKLARNEHPMTILENLELYPHAVFFLSDAAALAIRQGLENPRRRKNESSALARVTVAAQTIDGLNLVYRIESFQFENIGTADGVISVERDRLNTGEIEMHSHVSKRPDYLGKVDIGDLIATIEGPAWVDPISKRVNPAQRVFGILSVYPKKFAQMQFYLHDLTDSLDAWNNYGLKKFGLPISLPDAF